MNHTYTLTSLLLFSGNNILIRDALGGTKDMSTRKRVAKNRDSVVSLAQSPQAVTSVASANCTWPLLPNNNRGALQKTSDYLFISLEMCTCVCIEYTVYSLKKYTSDQIICL